MRKLLIKIIKREDAEATAAAKTQIAVEAEKASSGNKTERRLRREIAETISNWLPERNKNNRAADIDAVRKFFGSEHLLSEI